jgi:hypothetical protein
MDSTVKEIVAKVKKALDADPTSIVAGEMRNGLPEASRNGICFCQVSMAADSEHSTSGRLKS